MYSNVKLLYLLLYLIGTFSNEDGNADTTANNNSKYNNCTLECIELGTCTESSFKLEREKTFFWSFQDCNDVTTDTFLVFV